MRRQACVDFLKEQLPALGLRWTGYRKVHRQVCKRLARRLRALGLADLEAYRVYLAAHPEEWPVFDAMCWIPTSRFYRDREVWDALRAKILPLRAVAARREGRALDCWSAGCASGEEPYTLALCWRFDLAKHFPATAISIRATDANPVMLERARTACYTPGSLRELPVAWRAGAFEPRGDLLCLRPELRSDVRLAREDLRRRMPAGPFDLVLCRNLVFTYFDAAGQRAMARKLAGRLRPGGALVLGKREALPEAAAGLVRTSPDLPIYLSEASAETAARARGRGKVD